MIAVDIHKTDAALSEEITVAMSPGFDGRPPYQISSCPDLIHGCPVERLRQCRSERRELQYNCKSPCPDLIRASTVLAGEITKPPEDVDAHGSSPWAEGPRVKPGHGDLWLSKDRCRQPISLNRTAVDLIRHPRSHDECHIVRQRRGYPRIKSPPGLIPGGVAPSPPGGRLRAEGPRVKPGQARSRTRGMTSQFSGGSA
jgi:hypothetical protein